MPRVFQRKARKDYPQNQIAKGDSYYYWKIKSAYGGTVYRSKTYPRPSQLNHGFSGLLGDLQQDLAAVNDLEGLASFAEEVRALGEEQDEKFNNMPEGLQQGSTGELLEERRDQCSEWADAIEEAANELEQELEELDARIAEWTDYDSAAEDDADEPDGERPDDDARETLIREKVDQAESACPF
jgi:hypothetical protein